MSWKNSEFITLATDFECLVFIICNLQFMFRKDVIHFCYLHSDILHCWLFFYKKNEYKHIQKNVGGLHLRYRRTINVLTPVVWLTTFVNFKSPETHGFSLYCSGEMQLGLTMIWRHFPSNIHGLISIKKIIVKS